MGLLKQMPQGAPQKMQSQDMSEEQATRFTELFQIGYNYLKDGENFKVLTEHAKQNPVEAVSVYISNLTKQLVQGEEDPMVITTVLLGLTSNTIEFLKEAGININEQDEFKITGDVFKQAMNDIPVIANAAQSDLRGM